jgi:signal transduction histidine kinase
MAPPLLRAGLRFAIGSTTASPASTARVNADGVLLSVVDSGPSLPDSTKIFDRLWRGDVARTGTGVHCGIGLALAKSLAEHMQLALTAANQSDGSVRFAISRQC